MTAPRPVPSPNETDHQLVTSPNETTRPGLCAGPGCTNPIPPRPTGRPARFCSTACRARSHRTHPPATEPVTVEIDRGLGQLRRPTTTTTLAHPTPPRRPQHHRRHRPTPHRRRTPRPTNQRTSPPKPLTSYSRGISRCSTSLNVVGDNSLDWVTPVCCWDGSAIGSVFKGRPARWPADTPVSGAFDRETLLFVVGGPCLRFGSADIDWLGHGVDDLGVEGP